MLPGENKIKFVNNTPERAVFDDRPLPLVPKLIFTNLRSGRKSQTLLNNAAS